MMGLKMGLRQVYPQESSQDGGAIISDPCFWLSSVGELNRTVLSSFLSSPFPRP